MNRPINTKIIATLGPASSSEDAITQLVNAGATIFRLNTSHGTMEIHQANIERIRTVEQKLGRFLTVLVDLQGPKIRIGTLEQPLQLHAGEHIPLQMGIGPTITAPAPGIIPVDYPPLAQDVSPGDRLLINDGRITLAVEAIQGPIVTARVIDGGELTSRKGLNLPGNTASTPALTQRDKTFVKFAVEHNADYLALSFVRSAEDVLALRDELAHYQRSIPVIAKLEKPQAIENLTSILSVADGVMVARGDLGVEMSPEKVPLIQKKIILRANLEEKVVITATQMLESMIQDPMPTRAEASDVANAILDGTDVIMLSGETAMGQYPIRSVQMMQSIASEIETSSHYQHLTTQWLNTPRPASATHHVAIEILRAFNPMDINAIVVCSRSGFAAQLLAKARLNVPIIAICQNEQVCRRINLHWGIYPCHVPIDTHYSEAFIRQIDAMLQEKTFLKSGDKVIITSGLPALTLGKTNFIRYHQLGPP